MESSRYSKSSSTTTYTPYEVFTEKADPYEGIIAADIKLYSPTSSYANENRKRRSREQRSRQMFLPGQTYISRGLTTQDLDTQLEQKLREKKREAAGRGKGGPNQYVPKYLSDEEYSDLILQAQKDRYRLAKKTSKRF